MSTLTLEMLREAQKKIGTPPPKQEIRCGDANMLRHAMETKTGKEITIIKTPNTKTPSTFVMNGMEVRVCDHLPADKAVLIENGRVTAVIDLRDENETDAL